MSASLDSLEPAYCVPGDCVPGDLIPCTGLTTGQAAYGFESCLK